MALLLTLGRVLSLLLSHCSDGVYGYCRSLLDLICDLKSNIYTILSAVTGPTSWYRW